MNMIALCLGHARDGDKGASSTTGIYEEDFNSEVMAITKKKLTILNIPSVMITHYNGGSYGAAMTFLGNKLKQLNATLALEFHFNSAGPTANGFEYLHWATSVNSKSLATYLNASHSSRGVPFKNRGVTSIKSEGDRGGQFLRKTPCPAVILEPFFGSNKKEVDYYMSDKGIDLLSTIYSEGIKNYIIK